MIKGAVLSFIRSLILAFDWGAFFLGWLADRILMAIPLPEKLYFKIQLACHSLWKTLSREEVSCTYYIKTREMDEPQAHFERIVNQLPSEFQIQAPRDEFIVYKREI